MTDPQRILIVQPNWVGDAVMATPTLRASRFDLAILLPNSFKSALVCKMAGIDRVVGYERDGRGFLITDKLLPVKERGKFIPTPIVKYYVGIAQYLGSTDR